MEDKKEKKERMTGNEIGNKGAKAMSEMLKTNTALTALYLWSEEKKKTIRNKEGRKKMNDRQ